VRRDGGRRALTCPGCGAQVREGAIKCSRCMHVLDEIRLRELRARVAETGLNRVTPQGANRVVPARASSLVPNPGPAMRQNPAAPTAPLPVAVPPDPAKPAATRPMAKSDFSGGASGLRTSSSPQVAPPVRRRRWGWAVVVGVFLIFGALGNHQEDVQRQQDAVQRQNYERQGYVDTGRQLTADQCTAEGGRVSGNFCLAP
jgi:hypothetical protein